MRRLLLVINIILIVFISCTKPDTDNIVTFKLSILSDYGFVYVKSDNVDLEWAKEYVITAGSSIALTTVPDTNYSFDSWSGDINSKQTTINFVMDSNKTVVCNYVALFYTLNINAQYNTVKVYVDNIVLNDDMSYIIENGKNVTLKWDVGNPNYIFDSWSGDINSKENPITFIMNSDKLVYANVRSLFTHKLNISQSTLGDIDVYIDDIKQNKQTEYNVMDNSIIKLIPLPTQACRFVSWNGDYTSIDNPLIFNITKDITVGALFIEFYTLNLICNNANVNVIVNNIMLDQSSSYQIDTASIVELIPVIDDGYMFEGWEGDILSNDEQLEFIMDSDKSLTLNTCRVYTLTININSTQGYVEVSNSSGYISSPYRARINEILTVFPKNKSKYQYFNITGDVNSSNMIVPITMDRDKTITINYQYIAGKFWTQLTTSAQWSARYNFGAVVYNNKIWVMGGQSSVNQVDYKKDVWYSTDGINWTQATANANWAARAGFSVVVWDNKMWVLGGAISSLSYVSTAYYSTDGVNWTNTPLLGSSSGERTAYVDYVFDNAIYEVGGYRVSTNVNQIYKSIDMYNNTWQLLVNPTVWGGLEHSAGVIYDNKLWLINGRSLDGNSTYKTIWNSTDGINWTSVNTNPPFADRNRHNVVVYDNQIWLLGGQSYNATSDSVYNDIWRTTDGITWTQVTSAASWHARSSMKTVVLNDKMYIFGGLYINPDTSTTKLNDVWVVQQ